MRFSDGDVSRGGADGVILPPDAPRILRIAIVTILVVATMSYVVGPLLTRLFRKWLQAG